MENKRGGRSTRRGDNVKENNNDLYHYGILGMKWGVRRTKTQLVRARKSSRKSKLEAQKKKIKSMSDDELRKKINRLQMEKQYSQLSAPEIGKGRKFAKQTLAVATTVASVTGLALTIHNNFRKIGKIAEKVGGK